jgi:hypothetical protein
LRKHEKLLVRINSDFVYNIISWTTSSDHGHTQATVNPKNTEQKSTDRKSETGQTLEHDADGRGREEHTIPTVQTATTTGP